MADEIRGSNEIRVVKDGSKFIAWIGPDPQSGLMATGSFPEDAVIRLMLKTKHARWCWDESWRAR